MEDLARQRRTKLYEIFDTPECQPFLPEKAPIGEMRQFTPNQALLLMIHSDLNRWGLSVPFAGRVTCRIGEELFRHPDASRILISFHENGASFFNITVGEETHIAGAGNGAGQVRFCVLIDFACYRDAIGAALESQCHEA
jgi:hypothetical protein